MLELDTTADGAASSRANIRTLGHQLDSRLERLLRALGKGEQLRSALRTVKLLTNCWRNQPVSRGPWWCTDITDDHTPFEFSLALDSAGESLRILTEPQDPVAPSLRASWDLACSIHEDLNRRMGIGFSTYNKVAMLFEPSSYDEAAFCVWHAAVLGSQQETKFKVYLNPCVHGVDNAAAVVSEALERLGFGREWERLARTALVRGRLDQILYFSLDLADSAEARVKVYVAHGFATATDVARALSLCPGFAAEDIERWCQHLMRSRGPFTDRPPISCFALRRGEFDLYTTTLHLPVRCYGRDDFDIAARVCRLLSFRQRVVYMRALTGFAERPLEGGTGLQSYASLRASPGREAVTVYLAPQVYTSSRTFGVQSIEGPLDPARPTAGVVTTRGLDPLANTSVEH